MTNKLKSGGLAGSQIISERQKVAGNYEKAHRVLHGMRLSVENAAGTTRRGTDPQGQPWEQRLAHDYGYLRGSVGKDKDHLDVFFGPQADDPEALVHVIDQNKKGSEDFDESKVMLGFGSPDEAVMAYHQNYEPGWAGFRGVTSMPLGQFKEWAYAGKAGKRKPAADYVRFQQDRQLKAGGAVDEARFQGHARDTAAQEPPGHCGCGEQAELPAQRREGTVLPRQFADGGSVRPTPQELERLAQAERPFVGYRSAGRRRAEANDREAAKEVPVAALRGLTAGTLGFGGDMEGLGRQVLRGLGADVDATPLLPTGDFYREALPLRPTGAAGKAAESVGSALGVPLSSAVRLPARALASGVEGALETAGRGLGRAYLAAEPAIERGVQGVMQRGGLPAQLLQDLALGTTSQAVKPRGGNWRGELTDRAAQLLAEGAPEPVAAWLQKRVPNYIRNDLGTAADPLLKLEQQGRLHLTPEDLLERARDHAMMGEVGTVVGRGTPAVPGQFYPVEADFHKAATGRDYATPWESLADSSVWSKKVGELPEGLREPWMSNVGLNTDVHWPSPEFRNLGFDHVRDYLNQAVSGNPDLIARNLHIDPAQLPKMSLSDVVSKTSDWNNFIYKAKQLEELNKGIKSVVKEYPETGHQWVELAPEGLKAEGDMMRHCVGGYCSSVESGAKRILSLRGKDGKPQVTVELSRPESALEDPRFQVPRDVRQRLENDARVRYEREHPNYEDDPDEYMWGVEELRDRMMDDWARTNMPKKQGEQPWNIQQIKGPANRAPSAEALPAVQDLVKNLGPWGEVRDLENTGLTRVSRPYFARGASGEINVPQGIYTQDELTKFFTDAGEAPDAAKLWIQGFPRSGYASGGSVSLPTFGVTSGGQGAQSATDQAMQLAQAQGAQSRPFSASGLFAGQTPGSATMAAPLAYTGAGAAPTYDPSDPASLALAQAGGSMGAGWITNGVSALDPTRVTPWNTAGWQDSAGDDNRGNPEYQGLLDETKDWLTDTARRLGYDLSGYNLDDWGDVGQAQNIGYQNNKQVAQWLKDQGLGNAGLVDLSQYGLGGQQKSLTDLKADMDKDLKDLYFIKSASAGWDGRGDMRSTASSTYYKGADGKLYPITASQGGRQPEDPGWVRGDGAELITGLSMMMPALGGWASLLGSGAAGTATAGGGLGLTSALPSAAVNAGVGAALGGGYGALAGGLGGYLGGLGGSALYGQAGQALGQQVGSQVGRSLYNQSRSNQP